MPRTPHCVYCPIAIKKTRHAVLTPSLLLAEEAVWPPADLATRRQILLGPAALAATKALIHQSPITPIERQLDAERDARTIVRGVLQNRRSIHTPCPSPEDGACDFTYVFPRKYV